jgi:RimJ/RimL family protein N-acetyltransferase
MNDFYLRKVEFSDIRLLYEWANDPVTRTNAFNSASIPYDTHQDWFLGKLNSPNVLQFIFIENKKNIGQIRFDVENGVAAIDYSIGPEFRGNGYGKVMLAQAESKIKNEYLQIKELYAEVKENNISSVKTFKALCYSENKQDDIIIFKKKIQHKEGFEK